MTARARLAVFALALGSALVAQTPAALADTNDLRGAGEPAFTLARFERPGAGADTVGPAPFTAERELGAGVNAPIEFGRWKGVGAGTYLAPKRDFIASDGGVDVVFHFHAGQMSDKELRASGLNAVFVSYGFGIGSGAYADAFANPTRFERMIAELTRSLEKDTGRRDIHIRKLALASWSAGFAAVGKILGVDRYYGMVDSVVLLDSLHSRYKEGTARAAAQGADKVDLKGMAAFVRFAKDAAAGKKAMVITHSAIIPPDYPSASEATAALLTAINVPGRAVNETTSRGMLLSVRADAGNLHVRGFRGQGPRDHFQHLHLIGEALESWVVPRWKREERLVYTLAGEPL